MHGGMPIIRDREVDQLQRGVHSAHHTQSHSTADTERERACDARKALMARRVVPGEAEPCMDHLL